MLLLGHRGAADAAHPENTVAAVERALRHGADGVEVDVRLIGDDGLICLHDSSLRRVAGIAREVATMTAAELAGIRLPGGHPLPSLPDVVDATRDARLVVELKTALWPAERRTRSALALAGCLRRLGVTRASDVVVSSFDRDALAVVRREADVRTAVLARPSIPAGTAVRWALDGGHDEVHPHVRALLFARPSLARDAHALGLRVTAWTVDRRTDLRELAVRGVDAAICDDPGAARLALPAKGARR